MDRPMTAKYSDRAPDHEQLLHVDFGDHAQVVPRRDIGHQHLDLFVSLRDVGA